MKDIYKVLFMGSMGVGKTTAITALSQTTVVSTEAINNDTERFDKLTTTVGLDYGMITIEDTKVHLFGTPGQEKFSFVWETLVKGSDGVVVLINYEQENSLAELENYLNFLKTRKENLPTIVGIGRATDQYFNIKPYEELINKYLITCPIFLVDVRKKADCLFLLQSLTYQIFD